MKKSYVYILKCKDGTFYTGWTLDLNRRLTEHNSNNSKTKYTRNKRPVELVYFEECNSKSEAMKRECQIKQLTKKQKIELIYH